MHPIDACEEEMEIIYSKESYMMEEGKTCHLAITLYAGYVAIVTAGSMQGISANSQLRARKGGIGRKGLYQ